MKYHQTVYDSLSKRPEVNATTPFVIDRGGKVFNRSAPIITLREDATEDEFASLLGVINTSTVLFWMTQISQVKGDGERGLEAEEWFRSYEFTSTGLKRLPLPDQRPLTFCNEIVELSDLYSELHPHGRFSEVPSVQMLEASRTRAEATLRQLISLQEELDWQSYRLYGIVDDDLCYHGDDRPELLLGQRAFEIVMARRMARGELETIWFERHGSTPITEIPSDWPSKYRELVEARIQLIENDRDIGLIETPECKRRWCSENWASVQHRALRNWLLDRLESDSYWPSPKNHHPQLRSVAELSAKASGDHEFMQVAAIYRDREDFDVFALLLELVESESVPLLPALRFKPSGLRKRHAWDRVWQLQRQQDSGDNTEVIGPPPKYSAGDYLKPDYWRLRGRLDVAKERWISFPHCERDGDDSLVVGWAGWDHLQRATAIVAYYDARKNEGWTAERLKPLLAAIDELLPWIHQWHPEIDPEYNETAGTSFQTLLESEAQELGLTLEDIRNWTPPKKTTRRKKKKASS